MKGHLSERYTISKECCECAKVNAMARYRLKPKKPKMAKKVISEEEKKARDCAYAKISYYKNREKVLERNRLARMNWSDERIEKDRAWKREYGLRRRADGAAGSTYKPRIAKDPDALDRMRAENCFKSSKRRGARIPTGRTRWEIISSTIPLFKIKRELEESTGIRHHVDHITPIFMGGTHELKNLRVMSEEEHKEKTLSDKRFFAKLFRAYKGNKLTMRRVM